MLRQVGGPCQVIGYPVRSPPESFTFAPRPGDASVDTLANALPLELRECRQDVELELPGWRCAVDALPETDERYANVIEVFQHRHQVPQVASKPGQTFPEKFEGLAAAAEAAIALATPDDLAGSLSNEVPRIRARQNVWVEVGWFWGRLGRSRVLILVRGDVEIPSDLDGIEFYPYPDSVLEVKSKIHGFLR